MTTSTTLFGRVAAFASAAVLSLVLISGTVTTPAATATVTPSNASAMA